MGKESRGEEHRTLFCKSVIDRSGRTIPRCIAQPSAAPVRVGAGRPRVSRVRGLPGPGANRSVAGFRAALVAENGRGQFVGHWPRHCLSARLRGIPPSRPGVAAPSGRGPGSDGR